jgi:prepilin-type N-terminal cleavage/methylation domain-containing protein
MNLGPSNRRQAFTLLELLAVVATIAILAALLLPILSKTKIKAQQTSCMSNLRQLGFAWATYADENNELLVESYPTNNAYVWVKGNMHNPAEAGDQSLVEAGKLFSYTRNAAVYHCPADQGVPLVGKVLPTVRSYSMNCFMGGRDPNLPPIPDTAAGYKLFFSKSSELQQPSQMWVLLDEDERSINDGFFITDPTARIWFDFPANSAHRHNFSYALSFADGHSDIWRHKDARTQQVGAGETEQANNADLGRLAHGATTAQ